MGEDDLEGNSLIADSVRKIMNELNAEMAKNLKEVNTWAIKEEKKTEQ